MGFFWTILVLCMETVFWITSFKFCPFDWSNGGFFSGPWINLSHLIIFCWALIAFKESWQVLIEVGCFVFRQIAITFKKTLPRFQNVAKSKNASLWDDQLECTWTWVDDRDMDRLLQKEEDTRVFRLARRRMSRRRGWMLKSRAFKSETKQSQIGTLRARTCSSLFTSWWQKYFSFGMRRKPAAWSTSRRLRVWVKRNICL